MPSPITTPHCTVEQLHRVLADATSDSEEAAIAAHLTSCDACRRQLESLAADDGTWTRARSWLSNVPSTHDASKLDPTILSPLPSSGDDDAFDIDFAVQFLDPCDAPGSIGRLSDIEIREVIGRGAMGVVLKGWQPELNRFVAVKVMSPYLAVSGAARRRFEREAQAAAAILHPNVMPIHSVSATARLPYLVMPYLACESLQQRIDRDGALPLTELLQIGVQVARGLAAAHAQGLVHRDVKPANILLERGVDRVMLTDFGLARAVDDASLTRSGVIAGTPQYMSPEQARGDAVDQRSDLFSFGSVMYAMAAGRPPFRAESSYAILRRLSEAPPRALTEIDSRIPDWLATLVSHLHAGDRTLRIQSAAEVADLLEQCLTHVRQPQSAPLPELCCPPRPSVSRTLKRHRVLVGSLAGIAAVSLAIATWQLRPDSPEDLSASSSQDIAPPTTAPENIWDDDIATQLEHISARVSGLEAELNE